MPLLVEYLAIIKNPQSFCATDEKFLHLLQLDPDIALAGDAVSFKGSPAGTLHLTSGEVPSKNQRYFQLKFTWSGNANNVAELDTFLLLLRAVRQVIKRVNGEIEQLRNDVSSHFAQQAYPLIHEVENAMRRLITNFMLVNVGLNWTAEALPDAVDEALRKSKKSRKPRVESEATEATKDYVDALYELDFSHLGMILFKPYSKRTASDLYAHLTKVGSVENIESLTDFIPKSNWQRYFAQLIDCEDGYLSARWEKLYELRCKVAHNSIMTGRDYADIRQLIDEVLPKINEAISKLPQVNVPAGEVEVVAENAAQSLSVEVGEFITQWKQLQEAITLRLSGVLDFKNRPVPPVHALRSLGVFNTGYASLYDSIRKMRNQLVHDPNVSIEPVQMRAAMVGIEELKDWVKNESYISILRAMTEDARHDAISTLLYEENFDILNSDEVSSAIAETNAFDFDVDDIEIDDIEFDDELNCVTVKFTFAAHGEADDERLFSGDTVTGSGTATIDSSGGVSFDELSAEVEHPLDDDEQDFDE